MQLKSKTQVICSILFTEELFTQLDTMKYLSSNFVDWKSNDNVSLPKSQTNWMATDTEALVQLLSEEISKWLIA